MTPAVEIWAIDVFAELRSLDRHLGKLAADEIDRASRFRLEADRTRFIVARGTLRELLGMRLGIAPPRVGFALGDHGKPMLANAGRAAPHFNSSHSGRWVLHAFADVPVGVDVEEIRPGMADLDDFAWVLSPKEREFVSGFAGLDRARAMATVWVRKEAYVKALGEGLSRSLAEISVATGEDGRARLDFDAGRPADPQGWNLEDMQIDPAYRACVAYAGHRRPIGLRQYRAARPLLRRDYL